MLLPDESSSAASAQRVDGLVVNGNHYVLDTNIDQTSSGNGSYRVIRAVNVKTPRNNKKRVSTRYHVYSLVPCFGYFSPTQHWFSQNLKVVAMSDPSSASTEAGKAATTQSSSKKDGPNEGTTAQKTRVSSFSYAWLFIYIVYKTRNFIVRKNRQVYEEDLFLKEYGLEYKDDYSNYSGDHSFYGSISDYKCELHKFDLDDV